VAKSTKLVRGLSTGLVWFILLVVGFTLMGYEIFFAIVLAVVGGVAIGSIVNAWHSESVITRDMPDRPVDQTFPDGNLPSAASRKIYREARSFYDSRQDKLTLRLPKVRFPGRRSSSADLDEPDDADSEDEE